MIKIKFVRKFVMFTTHVFRDDEGLMKTVNKQYHVEPDNKLHVVDDADNVSKNNITFTFAVGGIYDGQTTVDRSNVEVVSDPEPVTNFGEKGCC